jgi:DNA-binding MarR family transcriptional regulator
MSPIMAKSSDNVNHSGRTGGNELLDLVHHVMHQYRSRQYRALRDGPHDITHMDSKVLSFFERRPGATQSDLAQHTGRDKAQIARLIKGLREQGLLAGEADSADRRNVRLTLTPEGLAIQRALKKSAAALGVKAVAGLSAADQAQLKSLLDKVKDNLDAA